jgi:hypothetical protein
MTLGCEVHDRARPMRSQQKVDYRPVADVAADKDVARIGGERGKVAPIAGVGQRVEVHDRLAGLANPVQDEVGAYEAGTAVWHTINGLQLVGRSSDSPDHAASQAACRIFKTTLEVVESNEELQREVFGPCSIIMIIYDSETFPNCYLLCAREGDNSWTFEISSRKNDLAALRQQILDQQNYQDPAAAGLLELEARERASAAAERQAIERDAERFKDAYKGREARLAEREADIGKQKGTNTGLAFLNAGLAIMSTPGGLATAIGKGAQVGTAQFAAGLDKIRSAQERLGEARDRLDDLKLNREETTAKELRAAENNYRRVGIDAQKRTIDGIRMAADVNEKRATDIYSKTVDLTKTVYEQGEQTKRSAAQIAATLNTPDRILFDQLLKKNGNDAVKALEAFKVAKGDKFDVRTSYADYLKAFAGKEGLTPPMSMGAYAGQFGATLPR